MTPWGALGAKVRAIPSKGQGTEGTGAPTATCHGKETSRGSRRPALAAGSAHKGPHVAPKGRGQREGNGLSCRCCWRWKCVEMCGTGDPTVRPGAGDLEGQTQRLQSLPSPDQQGAQTAPFLPLSPALTQGCQLLRSVDQPPGPLNLSRCSEKTHGCHCQSFPRLEGRGMDRLTHS